MTPTRPATFRVAAAAAGLLVLAACTSSSGGGPAVAVTSTDTECRVGTTSLKAGTSTFEVENAASKVTEVYIYASGDKVVAEKENVGPGTKARFNAKLSTGSYEVACKPGQTGKGIRQILVVS